MKHETLFGSRISGLDLSPETVRDRVKKTFKRLSCLEQDIDSLDLSDPRQLKIAEVVADELAIQLQLSIRCKAEGTAYLLRGLYQSLFADANEPESEDTDQ